MSEDKIESGAHPEEQEIDLIEDYGTEIKAYEIKAGNKEPKMPKTFSEAYPEAEFNVINRDTYTQFIR